MTEYNYVSYKPYDDPNTLTFKGRDQTTDRDWLLIRRKKTEDYRKKIEYAKGNKKFRKKSARERFLKLLDQSMATSAGLYEIEKKLKKDYKLFRKNFYILVQIKDLVMKCVVLKECDKNGYFRKIEDTFKEFQSTLTKKDLEEFEGSVESGKMTEKRDHSKSFSLFYVILVQIAK